MLNGFSSSPAILFPPKKGFWRHSKEKNHAIKIENQKGIRLTRLTPPFKMITTVCRVLDPDK
jgi:hypothetical protein